MRFAAMIICVSLQNPSKKFPQISSSWNDTPQESMDPTLRLVNQMNVAKETNLLVYKSKDKKRKNLTMSAAARQQKDTARYQMSVPTSRGRRTCPNTNLYGTAIVSTLLQRN